MVVEASLELDIDDDEVVVAAVVSEEALDETTTELVAAAPEFDIEPVSEAELDIVELKAVKETESSRRRTAYRPGPGTAPTKATFKKVMMKTKAAYCSSIKERN